MIEVVVQVAPTGRLQTNVAERWPYNAIEDFGDQFSSLGIKPVTLDDHGQIKASSNKITLSMVTGASEGDEHRTSSCHHASFESKNRGAPKLP